MKTDISWEELLKEVRENYRRLCALEKKLDDDIKYRQNYKEI